MPRIPKSELDRLKAEVSLERLAEARGVKLRRKGKDLHGLCPFHEDRDTESLVISPDSNLWHCLGACQEGGSVIDWVMKAEGVSFTHAVQLLRADMPVAPAGAGPVVKASTVKKLPGLASSSVEDQVLLRRVVEFYQESLRSSSKALGYLKSRGLVHPEMAETFKLGFADRTLGYRLPDRNRKEGAALRGRLQDFGILRSSGHEHFRGSIVVPLFDADGRVVQMYGRKVTPNLRKGTPSHLYLPGPQRGVFNLQAFGVAPELILTESIFDALTFWCHSFRNVTCTYGTSGLTQDVKEALRKYGTERVLIAFDRDAAGDKAAERVADELVRLGVSAYRVQFPKGQDANEYAQKVTPPARSLALVVRNALWLGKGKEPERAVAPKPQPASEEATKEEGASPPMDTPSLVAEAPAEPEPEVAPEPKPEPKPEPAPVQRVPDPPRADELDVQGEELWLTLGDRSYRVRGLGKNLAYEVMKVNVLVRRGEVQDVGSFAGAGFHVDTLDLYSARHRAAYVKEAAAELAVEEATLKKDLGRLLLALEAAQEDAIQERLRPKSREVELSDDERDAALELLRDPRLLERVLEDFEVLGVVGEETNKLVGYLAATSRKLERPLAVVIQSSSAAGKSSLMDAVLQLMPEEERVSYSAMTGQSLFYMGETDLGHKILAIAEEEGAERASYALKLLQSEGELTIASTGKDPATGRLTTQEYRVEGPVMIFLTTTAIEMDEELLNRCLVLSVDEGREQTRAIHKLQRKRETLRGLRQDRRRPKLLTLHRNAQRLLRPVRVANPYAEELTFLDHQTRMRRDHMKYLTLIRSIALLHQYQRELRVSVEDGEEVRYIEVTREDIALANRLAHEVLGRSLDELPPQTRRLLGQLQEMVAVRSTEQGIAPEDFRFTRREVREWTGMGNTQTKTHLRRLEEMEYVLAHSKATGQSYVYELVVHPEEAGDGPALAGLLDVESLGGQEYDVEPVGGGRPLVGPRAGGGRGCGRGGPVVPNPSLGASLEEVEEENPEDSSREALLGVDASRRVVPANGEEPPTPAGAA